MLKTQTNRLPLSSFGSDRLFRCTILNDTNFNLSGIDPLDPSTDDYLGWTFTEDRAIFNPVIGFAKEWDAMRGPFVVADFESTGLHAESDEILEFAALLVEPSGAITSQFSTLVKVEQPLRDEILKIVGITQEMVELEGQPLVQAMAAFLAFVGNRPVFIHHANFDQPFLQEAGEKTGQVFGNKFYDTLFMAMMIWTDWAPYSIDNLMNHLGLLEARPRAIDDAKATLTVLLAAREVAHTQNWD